MLDLVPALFGVSCTAPVDGTIEALAVERCKLSSSILTLVATTAIAVLGFLGKSLWEAAHAANVRRLKRKRSIVDLAVYAEFLRDDVRTKFSREAVEPIQRLIETGPGNLRLYVLATGTNYALNAIRAVRHTFRPREIALIDRYVDVAIHFRAYYEATAGDAFAALSRDRKKNVLMNLVDIGEQVLICHDLMKHGVPEIGNAMRTVPVIDGAASDDRGQRT
jgi:methylglyoxal synthase